MTTINTTLDSCEICGNQHFPLIRCKNPKCNKRVCSACRTLSGYCKACWARRKK